MIHTLEIPGWRDCLTFRISFSYNMPVVSSSFFHSQLIKLSYVVFEQEKLVVKCNFLMSWPKFSPPLDKKPLYVVCNAWTNTSKQNCRDFLTFMVSLSSFTSFRQHFLLRKSTKSLLIHWLQLWMAWGIEISKYSSLVDKENARTYYAMCEQICTCNHTLTFLPFVISLSS